MDADDDGGVDAAEFARHFAVDAATGATAWQPASWDWIENAAALLAAAIGAACWPESTADRARATHQAFAGFCGLRRGKRAELSHPAGGAGLQAAFEASCAAEGAAVAVAMGHEVVKCRSPSKRAQIYTITAVFKHV